MDTAGNPLKTAEMIAELESSGLDTRKDIVNGILDRKDESFPFLAKLATSWEYWHSDSVDEWSPICAIHLLAKMKHYRAQLAINSAILEYYDDTDDWLTQDMPYVVAHMGVGAIPTLTALMRHGDTDMFVRGMAAHALIMIIKKYPETKSKIVASIMSAAQKESDIETRTMLVDSLVDLLDPDLYGYLFDSAKTGFIEPIAFTHHDLGKIYASKRSSRGVAKDPLYIFEPQYKDTFAYQMMGQ